MRRELSPEQRSAIAMMMAHGLTPCVIASNGRWMPIQARRKRPWVAPVLVELVPLPARSKLN